MQPEVRRAAWLALAMALVAGLTVAITPRTFMADLMPREKLAVMIPEAFGEWELDRSVVPVPPSPDLQQVLDATYDETLARTYRNRAGDRVMLSVAYGRNQHKGMNTHRPEICYPAQGFKLVGVSSRPSLNFQGRSINVTQLVAKQDTREEPITYWLTVGERVTDFGYAQRAASISYGLRGGVIPDGVLVRVSSINTDHAAAFKTNERFIGELLAGVDPVHRVRLIGTD